jgi:Spy/CpxP family protein refolding chaperone
MARSLVPVLSIAALFAACSHNSPPSSTTLRPDAPSASTADGGRGRGGGPGRDLALLRNITLGADQQQRVDTIRTRYRTQMEQLRGQSAGDREAIRMQMRALMEKEMAEIRGVLTPDQQHVFDQNVADLRARMRAPTG